MEKRRKGISYKSKSTCKGKSYECIQISKYKSGNSVDVPMGLHMEKRGGFCTQLEMGLLRLQRPYVSC